MASRTLRWPSDRGILLFGYCNDSTNKKNSANFLDLL